MFLKGKSILITGGTGSLGQQLVKEILLNHAPAKIIVYSRDELKQSEMSEKFRHKHQDILRYFIGDVRDLSRLKMALKGVDYVIHAAALKQVPTAERDPFECIKTNVIGAENVIHAAIECGVKSTIALSTDKAANPVNLYGASKLCSDKLFVAGNSYSGSSESRFSVVRYGNVIGSRGSAISLFEKMKKEGVIRITDRRMTRFWITLKKSAEFVLQCLEKMQGGEIFVPKIPSMKLIDFAKAIAPKCDMNIVGIRPGEKLHEAMIPVDEARNSIEFKDYFIIQPQFKWWKMNYLKSAKNKGEVGKKCGETFYYSSDTNSDWLTAEDLMKIVSEISNEHSPGGA